MDKRDLLARLRATFRLELQDHLTELGRGLLALESGQAGEERAETIKRLFRAAHSLKGAARAVEYPDVADLGHAMEEVLGRLEALAPEAAADVFSLLFRAVDGLVEASKASGDDQPLRLEDAPALVEALRRAAEGETFSVPVRAARPPPPPARRVEGGRAPVELERLDALLTRSAELLVARGRARAAATDVVDVAERVLRWQRTWSEASQKAQSVLRNVDTSAPGVLEAVTSLSHAHSAIAQLARDLDAASGAVRREVAMVDRVAEPLEEQIRHVRMLPFAGLEPLLERAVRDAATTMGRKVRLEIEGKDVEADRAVLEGLKDPLVHLVRNAVVHGVEAPEVRKAAGKPEEGCVRVKAALRGPNVEIVVGDDGGGVDLDGLRRAAEARSLPIPSSDRDLLRLVFVSELSTRNRTDQIGGRGVGLDVVLAAVQALHGGIEIRSERGRGTTFTTLVPLTLTRLRALTMRAGGEIFCIASSNVLRLLRVTPDSLRTIEGRAMLPYEGELVPLADLAGCLGLPQDATATNPSKLNVVLVVGGDRRAGLVVEEFLAEREVVVQNLGPRLRRVRCLAGAVVTDSGRVGLLLSVGEVVRGARTRGHFTAEPRGAVVAERGGARLLVVDDSPTTRALVCSVLQGAGYQVETASDGAQAFSRLQSGAFDLVVTDVEMPNMTGFDLTRAVRGDPHLSDLPVILVTGLGRPEDRARGLEAGANAYLPKATFDQTELLATVGQLV